MAAVAVAVAPGATKTTDPIKAVEGMFNGCVTRLAYVLKDPKNFGESTPFVLAECTKLYHDALDDCEIRILDAKWLLEQKLSQNKANREAAEKAREASSAPKRKHDQMHETNEPEHPDTPSKRVKPADQSSPLSVPAPTAAAATPTVQNPLTISEQSSKPVSQPQATEIPKTATKESTNPGEQERPNIKETKLESPSKPEPLSNVDDFTKPSPPQPTPAGTNDEFNFESMFENDPANDDDANPVDQNDTSLNNFLDDAFGQDVSTSINTNQNQNQSQNNNQSLNSFLTGLDQDVTSANNATQSSQAHQNQDSSNIFPDAFGEPNIFDSLLADGGEDFEVSGANVNLGDMKVDDPGQAEMDWDDLFGDGD